MPECDDDTRGLWRVWKEEAEQIESRNTSEADGKDFHCVVMDMEGCGHVRLRKDLFPGGQGCQPLLTTFPRPFLAGCDPHIQGRTEVATGAVPRGLLKAVSGSTPQLTCISALSCLCLSRGAPTPGAPGGRETEEHVCLQGFWWHRSL